MSQQNDPPVVNSVSVKIPKFLRSNPEVWIKQVDAQFSLSKTTRQITKFNQIIASLEEDVLIEIKENIFQS